MQKKPSRHFHNDSENIVKDQTNEQLRILFSALIIFSMIICGTILLLSNKPITGLLEIFSAAVFAGGNYLYQNRLDKN